MIPGKTEVAQMQVRQGDKADLRQLEEGQFGYALDTGELYIGAPNEGRLAGREFRNLKLLTELNGVSSSSVSLLDVILQTGTNNGSLKLIRSFTNGEELVTDNIAVKNVLTEDNRSDFIAVENIYNQLIASGDTTDNKVPSLNSINLTIDNRLLYYIRNDKKTSDIIAIGSTDDENVTTPVAVDRTLTDRLQNYLTKAGVPQVITNVSDLTINADDITTTFSLLNTVSGASSAKILTFPSASATSSGLITANDYNTIQEYDVRISRLESSGVWKGSYENMIDLPVNRTDASLAGGYADINDFVTVVNGMDPHADTGQAVFRLIEFDETTGAIPQETVVAAQTVGSSLSDVAVDRMTFKRRTGASFDTDVVFIYASDYDYSYDGIATDPDTSASCVGEGYVVGDIVEYEGIQFEVASITETDPTDHSGYITGLTLLTTSGLVEVNETFAPLSDVTTVNRHDYPATTARPYQAAAVMISSTTGSNTNWVDRDDHIMDPVLYGVTYSGTPVVGDEITVTFTASGWAFDYWISVNIAIASANNLGVVRSSTDIDKVSVDLSGAMIVNSYQSHEQRITSNTNALTTKVAIAQGVANAGKILAVDTSGNVGLSNINLSSGVWDYVNSEFVSYAINPITDWNTLPSGIYNLTTDSNTLNSVPNDTGGDFHVTSTTYNGKTIQIAVDMSNPMKQYVRSYDGSTWTTWNYAYASWVPGNN